MKTRYIFVLLSIVLIVAGCSTQHNTWLSRGYQRMTSHYNVYFNGKEAFNSGLDKINTSVKEDYSRILPVYKFASAQNAKPASGDMESALKKAHKLVELHSITVKPKRQDNPTPRQRAMQLKDEYNPYVAEAYLLMGQANVVRHDEQEAFKVLDYVHQKFPSEHAAYESLIWKAIACSQISQFATAKGALDSYDLDGLAPSDLYFDYQRARANICLELGEYAEAIPFLESAIKEGGARADVRRLKYILAQVYREVGQPAKAVPLFRELSRSMADYDMAFAAKMELATVAVTEADMIATEKLLRKMSREVKNEEYVDQIFYALGKLQQTRGNIPQAQNYFRQSVNRSVSNNNQRGLSYWAMSDIAALEPDYLPEGMFADSAAQLLPVTNLRKEQAQSRASLLRPLVRELQIIQNNDSLLRIANMSERERERFIDDILSKEKERLEALEAQREAQESMGMSQSDFYRISGTATGSSRSSWYFYNTSLVQAGKSTFIKKWGQRANEDDWRRVDKSSNDVSQDGNKVNPDDLDANGEKSQFSDDTPEPDGSSETKTITRESLLAGLPLSPAAQEKCNGEVESSLFKSGVILYDDVRDYKAAAKQFSELLRRYPKTENRYDALTLLYFSASKNNDGSLAQSTASIIRNEYPNSEFASYLTQGAKSYFASADAKLEAHELLYKSAYDAYLTGQYANAQSIASGALKSDAESDYHSKYLLVRALSNAKMGNRISFEADLRDITAKYTNTPEDTLAQSFLAMLAQGKSPVAHEEYKSPLADKRDFESIESASADSKIMYEYKPDSPHAVVIIVDKDAQNRAQYRVADYNFTNFLLDDYDLSIVNLLEGRPAVIVSGFANKQAAMQYFYSVREQQFLKEVVTDRPLPQLYAIPVEQVRILSVDKDLIYDSFFNENYLQNAH